MRAAATAPKRYLEDADENEDEVKPKLLKPSNLTRKPRQVALVVVLNVAQHLVANLQLLWLVLSVAWLYWPPAQWLSLQRHLKKFSNVVLLVETTSEIISW